MSGIRTVVSAVTQVTKLRFDAGLLLVRWVFRDPPSVPQFPPTYNGAIKGTVSMADPSPVYVPRKNALQSCQVCEAP